MVRSAATRHRTLVRWDGPSAPPAAQLNMNVPMMLHAPTARHTAAPPHAHQPRSSPCAPSFPLMACALYPTVIDTQPETARREHPAYSDVLSPGQVAMWFLVLCRVLPCLSSHVQRMFCSAGRQFVRPCWGAMGTLTPKNPQFHTIEWCPSLVLALVQLVCAILPSSPCAPWLNLMTCFHSAATSPDPDSRSDARRGEKLSHMPANAPGTNGKVAGIFDAHMLNLKETALQIHDSLFLSDF